ncbi:MAG: carbohydrate kinase, partial [Lachnospiraceae bacterium]|nr:carbohydrate kinase [Lachnospiraceae bacterium]
MNYILAYDVGTTGVKTCLFEVGEEIRLLEGVTRGYPLYIMDNGGVEQDGDDWWNAMCESTRELFGKVSIKPSEILGISFCSQMQGLVLVDRDGKPVHRPMSYMDQRAKQEYRKGIANGIQIGGANIFKAIPSIIITGAIPGSVKDPVWKYNWVKNKEPENYKRIYKWLDVKDYLILRCTGRFVMTQDSAFATMIFDSRKGHMRWSPKMNRMTGVDEKHLPDIIKSTDMAGKLTAKAASELGLVEGIPVFGG